MEGCTGGSRLWIAQKHNIPINCLINDRANKFPNHPKISSVAEASRLFKHPPTLMHVPSFGIREQSGTATHTHLGHEFRDHELNFDRGRMWLEIMNKYGYQPRVSKQLKELLKI